MLRLLVAAARMGFPRPVGALAAMFPRNAAAVVVRLVAAAVTVGAQLVAAAAAVGAQLVAAAAAVGAQLVAAAAVEALDCLVVVAVGFAVLLLADLLKLELELLPALGCLVGWPAGRLRTSWSSRSQTSQSSDPFAE